ncbi:MAG: hypothetical protein JSS47_03265 [Proteobacteria bacterium]|nr:hypothetical protein [Pseudomonadota bacterium]
MTASKLEQRLAKLEGQSAEVAEPLSIAVRFIEPGTMRVTGQLQCINDKCVKLSTSQKTPEAGAMT